MLVISAGTLLVKNLPFHQNPPAGDLSANADSATYEVEASLLNANASGEGSIKVRYR
jgi:hypothetical protein